MKGSTLSFFHTIILGYTLISAILERVHRNRSKGGQNCTEKKFWITIAHHELQQQIFYVNIVTENALVTAAKEYLLSFDLL